ncbi:MAG: signal peptidase I [Syntrophaceae bacterium]|nr:signal peptidase I [Deltaproteobacteria bacterium]
MSGDKKKSVARDWAEALAVAFVIAMIIRAFILQAYRIPSSSMEDTLLKGDHILATKYTYGLTVPFTTKKIWGADRIPKRGDIIIFTFPENHAMDFVKRVIGLPGDTIEVREKKVYINGKPFATSFEKYTDPFILSQGPGRVRDYFGPVVVSPGHVFAMGDNRDQSYDSRFWGQVPIENIKGKALAIYFSWQAEKPWIRYWRIGHLVH